jgi:hypothetical protein
VLPLDPPLLDAPLDDAPPLDPPLLDAPLPLPLPDPPLPPLELWLPLLLPLPDPLPPPPLLPPELPDELPGPLSVDGEEQATASSVAAVNKYTLLIREHLIACAPCCPPQPGKKAACSKARKESTASWIL